MGRRILSNLLYLVGAEEEMEKKKEEEEKEMLGAERRVPSSPMAAARPRNTDAL